MYISPEADVPHRMDPAAGGPSGRQVIIDFQ
jgi:hypothetical protein